MDDFRTLALPRELSARNIKGLLKSAEKILRAKDLRLDGAKLTEIPKETLPFFAALARASERQHRALKLSNFSPELKEELSHVRRLEIPEAETARKVPFLENLGLKGFALYAELRTLFYLLSESIYWSLLGRFDKERLPFKESAKQILKLGSEATGIVFVLVFLIAGTLSLQSAKQLNMFGAADYLGLGIGFLMFAEIGPLLTSIILAGRSGSSITAEIASMTVAEEVKALKTMGIHPIQYLILPRFIAMSIAVPLLSFMASVMGCLAGFLIAYFFCDISLSSFLRSLRVGIPPILLLKSTFKSLVFGWIVTLIACEQGLTVRGGADEVGRKTTVCVVLSITGIILADAAFSFILY